MSHLDPSSLAQYNSLVDPHLQSYFSNERVRSHLKHAGLISGQGNIISDSEYRTKLARREHKKHVRHMLAENIVSRAIDMERARQAEMKRQFEMVAKAALVNNMKESRRRGENFAGSMSTSADMTLLALDTSWAQTRPKSATCHSEIFNEQTRIPRINSAHTDDDSHRKDSSKSRNRRRRRRSRLRSKTRSSSTQNPRSSMKFPDSSSNPCQIRMVYYGPKIKVDYDHLVFEPIDEIIVMQQHCGGENIIAFKDHLKSGAEFTFTSRRHADYPFGLTLYVKGFIDSRISTCCEYKHRHGVRLGGDRGHFSIISVKGSKPCIKCRYERQARLKKYSHSPIDKSKPIIIPLPVSDQPKVTQPPVQISVRHTSIPNENYSNSSDRQKHSNRDGYSTDSSIKRSHKNERKSKSKDLTPKGPKRVSPIDRKEISRKLGSTSDEIPAEKSTKKTWQIVFHASNIPTGRNLLLKFSFLANNGKRQTESHEMNMKQFNQSSKSENKYSFSIKLKNIGQPEQIRLNMQTTESDDDDDDDDDDEIKWHLDHIELIDPETQSHLIFPCKQWIRLLEEKLLRLSQEPSRIERKRKTSSSPNNSRQTSPKVEQKSRRSSRSSTSSDFSKQLQLKSKPARRTSLETESNRSLKSTTRDDDTNRANKVRYRVTIYPSNDDDGVFYPVRNSRVFLRLNNQTKETNLTEKLCPEFSAGEKQSFELDLIQNKHEKPQKLTIGYVNSDITASKWKLEKIILRNLQTGDEITFLCKQILTRDDSNFRAEKTFEIQSKDSDDESTPRNPKINSPKADPEEQIQSSQKQQQINRFNKEKSQNRSDDEEQTDTQKKQQTTEKTKKKSPSIQSKSDVEEQTEAPKKQQTNGQVKHRSPSIRSANEDEEQTPRNQQTNEKNSRESPSIQNINDNKKQTEVPKKPQTTGENERRSPSIRSTNDDEEQTVRSQQKKEKSPSFQSMNDEEAHYRKVFKQLDPKDELELGSPPPTPRPKTRRGEQDQNEEQDTNQPVDPLIGLDDLASQTARSNDQQTLSSLPSTTTDNTGNQSKRWRSTDRKDEDN